MKVKKIVIGSIIFLVLVVGLVASLFLVKQQQELRKKAAPASTISILPPNQSVRVGSEVTLTVELDTATNTVTAADIYITFDPQKVSLQSFTPGTFLPVVLIQPQTNNTTGTASITLGTQPANPPQGTGTLATLRFKGVASGSANIALTNQTRATGIGEATDILVARNGSTLTVTSTGAPTPTQSEPVPPTGNPTVTLTPTPTTRSVGGVTTPTPTKKAATATTKPTVATSSSLPVAGVFSYTFVAVMVGVLLFTLGILVLAL